MLKDSCRLAPVATSVLHVLPEQDARHATITAAQLTAMALLLRFAQEVSDRG